MKWCDETFKILNMKHSERYCPLCETQSIVCYDEFHGETFCTTCGLVLQDTTRISVVELMIKAEKKARTRKK